MLQHYHIPLALRIWHEFLQPGAQRIEQRRSDGGALGGEEANPPEARDDTRGSGGRGDQGGNVGD